MTSRKQAWAQRRVIIDLPLHWDGVLGGKVIKAEIVDIAPHLAHVATFAIHRDPSMIVWWQVSNVETGCSVFRIPTAGRWKQRVINNVAERLRTVSPQKCVTAIRANHSIERARMTKETS